MRFLATATLLYMAAMNGTAAAFPTYLDAWRTKYPSSTLDDRMQTLTGADCNVCHHPPSRSDMGNCYREDIIALLGQALTIEQALDQLDGEDSDGDGVANGVEINTPRSDQPGQVGYSPGLVGAMGTDPCAVDPDEVVTGELETPPGSVPTASTWGLVMMVLVMLAAATVLISRREGHPAI